MCITPLRRLKPGSVRRHAVQDRVARAFQEAVWHLLRTRAFGGAASSKMGI